MSERPPQNLLTSDDRPNTLSGARRKPWLAGLLSFLLPGLGQLYNGQAKRGVLIYSFSLLIQLFSLIALLEAPFAPFNIVLPLLAAFLARSIIPTVDAVLTAKRSQRAYQAKAYNKWYVYILILVVSLFLEPGSVITNASFGAIKVPAGSMTDTIMVGDRVLVNKFAYYLHDPFAESNVMQTGTPQRGDVVTFKAPDNKNAAYVKRVIGLPGDKIEIKEGVVYVNDKQISEPYVKFHADGAKAWGRDFSQTLVPQAHLFVVGDNRDNSADSREWGTIPQQDVISKAKKIYWSSDPQTGRVRWERIGQIIR